MLRANGLADEVVEARLPQFHDPLPVDERESHVFDNVMWPRQKQSILRQEPEHLLKLRLSRLVGMRSYLDRVYCAGPGGKVDKS